MLFLGFEHYSVGTVWTSVLFNQIRGTFNHFLLPMKAERTRDSYHLVSECIRSSRCISACKSTKILNWLSSWLFCLLGLICSTMKHMHNFTWIAKRHHLCQMQFCLLNWVQLYCLHILLRHYAPSCPLYFRPLPLLSLRHLRVGMVAYFALNLDGGAQADSMRVYVD